MSLSLSLSFSLSPVLSALSIKQLKEIIRKYGNRNEFRSSQNAVEKEQLVELCKICLLRRQEEHGQAEDEEDLSEQLLVSSKYDLVANICHDSLISQGVNIITEGKANAPRASAAETNVLQNGIYRIHVQNKVRALSLSLFLSLLCLSVCLSPLPLSVS
jgi:hypothetical protein